MALNNKQIAFIVVPIVSAGLIFLLQDYITKAIDGFLPRTKAHDAYASVQKKVNAYLDIESFQQEIEAIQAREKRRQHALPDLIERTFYLPKKEEVKHVVYTLSMAYPKKRVAIINRKIVAIGEQIDGAQLLKVEHDRALLLLKYQKKERKQWIHLFSTPSDDK